MSVKSALCVPIGILLCSVSLTFLIGCGGGGSASSSSTQPASITVTMNPAAASLSSGGTKSFSASVQNDSSNAGVTWSIGTGAGALSGNTSTSVTYTAPSTIAAAATVTLTATSVTDHTKTATAAISLTVPVVAVSVTPANPAVTTGSKTQFSAAVTGISDTSVTWSVNGVSGGAAATGTIDATGLYTAPAVVPSPNTVDITATSVSSPSASGSTTATINGTVESATQNITAAAGGTITLPSGSSVTIPAGALVADSNLTLALVNVMPAQPAAPGYFVGVGDALVLSTATPPFSTATGKLQFTIASGANSAGLSGSSGLADVVDATGDNFFGLPGSFDSTTNLGTVTLAAPLMNAATSVVVSMGNLPGPYTASAAVPALARSSLRGTPDAAAPAAGPKQWNGSGWDSFSSCSKVAPGTRILVLVHGMSSSIEDAYGNDGNNVTIGGKGDLCVNQINNQGPGGSPLYGQVVGFDYDWTTDINSGSGAALASFLDKLGACGYTIDVEAHSEGGPVAASGIMQVDSTTQPLINNLVGLGNPWDGTPTASGAAAINGVVPFTTLLANPLLAPVGVIEGFVPLIQGRTAQSVLNSPFLPQLQPGSSLLTGIQNGLAAKAPNMKMTLACGTQPNGIQLRVTEALGVIFDNADSTFPANDGIIGLPSCQGTGPTGTGNIFTGLNPRLLPPFALSHTQLACDPGVIQAVGKAVQSTAGQSGASLAASPNSIAFGTYQTDYSGPVPNQDLNITSSGSQLTWTATVSGGASWLSVSPASGTTPATPVVSAVIGPANSYYGTVTISAVGAANTVSIPVTLTVTAPNSAYAGTYSAPFSGTASDPNGGVYSASADFSFTLNFNIAADGTITGTASAPTNVNIAVVSCPSNDTCSANSFSTTPTGPITGSNNSFSANLSDSASYPFTINITGTISGSTATISGSFAKTFVGSSSNLPSTYNPLSGTITGAVLTKQ